MAGVNARHIRIAVPKGWREFETMPSWVLLPQLFLAAGWMRAGVASATTREWWTGETLRRFLEVEAGNAVGIYESFLSYLVEPYAVVVAAAVCLAELAIAALLVWNRWTAGALLAGAFLNVHFMLAGAVNPSAFYLVIAMVIMLWRLDNEASAATRHVIARRAVVFAGLITLGLSPFVTTIQPARVIEDPAIVLIFLSVLFAGAAWWADRESATD